ncbi:unnamed protein product [Echinostoma caproni]|uniref:Uncharacterized protein n=1 Tax=Echinostoma caproni TaxID=27848 RepID=A0A3P8HJ20_9TREM|nr:unnamed protein product [Echinostoma caproni]
MATHLRELLAQNKDEQIEDHSYFICDLPIAHLFGLESRLAMALGDYAHQTLSTPRADGLDQSTAGLDCSTRSTLDSSSSSPTAERSYFVERARLGECKRLTLSLETWMGAEEARLTGQIDWLKKQLKDADLSNSYDQSHTFSPPNSVTEEELNNLYRRCDRLASELAHLDETELAETKIQQSLHRQQSYIQRLDKLVDRLTSARQTDVERELEQFIQRASIEQFEQTLTKVLRGK